MTPPDRFPARTPDQAYQALLNLGSRRKNTQELLQFYVMEGFLARLANSAFRDTFVLKGGVLLMAYNARRPTKDIDFQALRINNDQTVITELVCQVADSPCTDGLWFDIANVKSDLIRDENLYSGVRVRMPAQLGRAKLALKVDVSVGDPIAPPPQKIALPCVLGGEIVISGYPISMVLAEKIVTAIHLGTGNTRLRDFADIYALVRCHNLNGSEVYTALKGVADHRSVMLVPLKNRLALFGDMEQINWERWRKNNPEFPVSFPDILETVFAFSDPIVTGVAANQCWDQGSRQWTL